MSWLARNADPVAALACARSTGPIAAVVGPGMPIQACGPADRCARITLGPGRTLQGRRSPFGDGPEHGDGRPVPLGSGREALAWLQRIIAEDVADPKVDNASPMSPAASPLWIGWIAYELGAALEPRAARASAEITGRRTVALWHRVVPIEADELPRSDPLVDGVRRNIGRLALRAPGERARTSFVRRVERVRSLIRRGDVYQANLSHTLRGTFRGSSRELFAVLYERSEPWYGVYVESPGSEHEAASAVLSFSPELCVRVDAHTRLVTCKPMKGTRKGESKRDELEHSAKDKAELAMIVDLVRNDISRVCEPGTVRVVRPRDMEWHSSGVWQATSTVQGRLADGLGAFDTLAAMFPCGSVTGAPKVRAMQIIADLERRERGVYCGCAGVVLPDGSACFNVAIRTLTLEDRGSAPMPPGRFDRARATYAVGAGIVVDSDASAEWEETLSKAAWILGASRGVTRGAPRAR